MRIHWILKNWIIWGCMCTSRSAARYAVSAPYCKVVHNKPQADAYKVALLKEIDLVCKGMSGKKQATSLYFGGGTPAMMLDDLKDIIAKLKENFILTGGIGVELHPSDITERNLQKLRDAGVTMLSIGIQSFQEDCLRKIGRRNDSFVEKIRLVRSSGFDVVDVDLIFAIPGQTDAILANDIHTAFASGATQVSTYPFIDFTFADNAYKPMSEEAKREMLEHLTDYCHANGIERTSVWTFAQRQTEKYSSVTRDAFLGFGVSATTLLKDIFKINTFSIPEYIKRIEGDALPTSLTLRFTKRQPGSLLPVLERLCHADRCRQIRGTHRHPLEPDVRSGTVLGDQAGLSQEERERLRADR